MPWIGYMIRSHLRTRLPRRRIPNELVSEAKLARDNELLYHLVRSAFYIYENAQRALTKLLENERL
jgi:hypothetical protein